MSVAKTLVRLERRLVGGGWLSQRKFDAVRENFNRYERARAEEDGLPDLSPIAFVETVRPRLSFVAWAAVRDIPLERAEDICERAAAMYGGNFFDFCEGAGRVPEGLKLGETLIRMNVLTREQLERSLELQQEIEERVGVRILLGILLVRQNIITIGAYFQAIAFHFGLRAERIDEDLLDRIEAAWQRKRG